MKHTAILLLMMLLLSQTVHAQRARNVSESSQNRQAMTTNEAQLERDLQELRLYQSKMNEFETAFANKNMSKVVALKGELTSMMKREIEQSEMKIAQDRQEVAQSKAELSSSNRESRRSRFDRTSNVRDDRRDKRDDQRDMMDDQSDLEQQIARTQRQQQIYAKLQAFTFSFEPSLREKAMATKALFQEFAMTMEADLAATQAEIAEDKREAVEDLRERREDQRERTAKRRTRNW